MDGAQGVLLSIAGGSDLGLFEINEAASLVQEAAHPEANIIFGTVIDDSLGDEVRVTVIAAGFEAGGPTHKKLEPTAFGSGNRSGSAVVAAGDSGSGATPAAASATTAPAATGTNGNGANQAGTLPPSAPSHGNGTGGYGSQPYAPPAPRRPETPGVTQPARTTEPPRHDVAAEYPAPDASRPGATPPVVPERPAPPYTTPVDSSADLDDDVDVPPFMKR